MHSYSETYRRSRLFIILSTWFMYSAHACIIPHFSRFYDLDLRLDDWKIGVLMAIPTLVMLCSQPLWGMLADRYIGRTKTHRLVLLCAAVSVFFMPFAYPLGGFFFLLFIAILVTTSYVSSASLSTSILLSFLGPQRRGEFGRYRVIGSMAFMTTMVALCPILVHYSNQFNLHGRTFVFIASSILFTIALICTQWNPRDFQAHQRANYAMLGKFLKDKDIASLYFSIFCVGIGSAAGMQYIGPFVGRLGLSEIFFSSIFLIGVGSEILLTFNLGRITDRVGLKTFMILGFCAEGLRWIVLSQIAYPPLILGLYILHGPAIAGTLFVTAMYLDQNSSESIRSTAQSFIFFSYCFGQMVGYLLGSLIVSNQDEALRVNAIQDSFIWFGGIAIFGAIFGLVMIPRKKERPVR